MASNGCNGMKTEKLNTFAEPRWRELSRVEHLKSGRIASCGFDSGMGLLPCGITPLSCSITPWGNRGPELLRCIFPRRIVMCQI
jgi:hypothetical protein